MKIYRYNVGFRVMFCIGMDIDTPVTPKQERLYYKKATEGWYVDR